MILYHYDILQYHYNILPGFSAAEKMIKSQQVLCHTRQFYDKLANAQASGIQSQGV